MTQARHDPSAHLPLKPVVYLLLLALAEEELHGYGLKKAIQQRTEGKVRLGPATLYRTIRDLQEQGFIEPSDERPDPALDDERRRYYRLTEIGRQVAAAETTRLGELVDAARASSLMRPA